MRKPLITLTTDFGLRDPYVAEMKAVILSICPNVQIIDITHQIEKFNIRMGAYALACAAPYFPKGTIHVAVVDPGVGTKRRPLIIEAEKDFFIGPDNGVLALATKTQGIKRAYEISNRKFMLPHISNTFHGRDIFAPAAAQIANGAKPSELGPEVKEILIPEFARLNKKKNAVIGEVLHVDSFGNIITNFGEKELKLMGVDDVVNIKIKDRLLELKLCKAYAEVPPKKPLAIMGSHNFLEISINLGNAAEKFKAKAGDKITLYSRQQKI